MWFFDHSYGFLGTLLPCVVVPEVSTARYVRYLLETFKFNMKLLKLRAFH